MSLMKKNRRILIIAIFSGVFVWFLDVVADYFLGKGTFPEIIIFGVHSERLVIRSLLFIYFSVMTFMLLRFLAEQVKSKAEVKGARENWRLTFDAVSDLVMVLDKDHKIVMANRAAEEFLKRPEKELLGHRCHELVHGTSSPPKACPTTKASRTKTHEEWDVELPNGGPWLAVSVDPILDGKGEINGFVHVVKDVTARKTSEGKLLLSSEIIEQSTEGLAAVDNSGKVFFANKAFARMHGYEKEELIGKDISLFHTPEQMTYVEEANRKLREKGEFSGEVWHARRDGTVFPAWMHNTLLRDAQGKNIGIIGTLQDITERKKAEEQARILSTRLGYLTKYANDFIILLDEDFRFLETNERVVDFYGYSREELLGMHPTQLRAPETKELFAEQIKPLLSTGKAVYETVHQRKDGTRFPVEISIRAVDVEEKRFYQAILRDITERKKAEEVLRESERKLREAQEIAHLGYWHWDVKTGDVKWSDEVFKIFCLDPAKFIPQIDSIQALSPWPGEHERDKELIRRATEKHETGTYEQRFLRPDGSIGYYYSSFQGNYDKAGELTSIVGTVQDITERKKAEEAIKISEAKYRRLFEAAKDGILIVDAETGMIVDANPFLVDMLGYPYEDLAKKHLWEINFLKDIVSSRVVFQELQEKGYIRYEDLPLETARGEKKEVEFVSNVYDVGDRKVIQCNIRDITVHMAERRKAEGELRDSERRLSNIIDFLPDATFAVDRQGKVIAWNRAIEKMTGIQTKDMIGKGDYEYAIPFYGTRRPILIDLVFEPHKDVEKLYRFVKREGDMVTSEAFVDFPGGGSLVLWGCAAPLYDREGEVIGAIESIRDVTERKRSEEALRKNEMLLRTILTSAPLGIAFMRNRTIEWANAPMADLTGYPLKELEGRNTEFLYISHEEYERAGRGLYGDGLKPGEVSYDSQWKKKDGTVIDVRTRVAAIDRAAPEAGYVATVVDISSLKSYEKKILDIARFPKENPSPVLRVDCHGTILYANPSSAPVLEAWGTRQGGKVPEWFQGLLTEMCSTLQPKKIETNIGDRVYLFNITPVPEEKFANIYGDDITDMKKAEEERERSEEEFGILLASMTNAFAIFEPVLDGEGKFVSCRFVYVNSAYEKMRGVKNEEVKGKTMHEVWPDTEAGWVELYGEVAATGIRKNFEMYHGPTGKTYYCNVYRPPMEKNRFCVVSEDITERKKAEKELEKYRGHLEELVKERTDELESFSYSVSHDLRAPIRAIDGFTRILAEEFGGKLDQEGRRIVGVIIKSTKDMGKLIDDLLDFSRLGRRETQFTTIDMEMLVKDVAEGLMREDAGRKVMVETGHLPEAVGDRAMIQIALVNLLSNAFKFTRKNENTLIEIGGYEKDGMTVYFVRDNGVGFDMKYAPKLFGVFQRLHSQDEFEGTGIGLAMVKRIISKNGGRVWAEGEMGKGACFYFSLPKRNA